MTPADRCIGCHKTLAQVGGQRIVCQRCNNVGLCPRCGEPYPRAPGADVLHDDGTVGHVPVIAGMGLRCSKCQG
jgi:hypothetical protein